MSDKGTRRRPSRGPVGLARCLLIHHLLCGAVALA